MRGEKGGFRHPKEGAWATGGRQQMHESGCGGKAAAADAGSKAGRSGVSTEAEAEAHGTPALLSLHNSFNLPDHQKSTLVDRPT